MMREREQREAENQRIRVPENGQERFGHKLACGLAQKPRREAGV
jgi:hypothetical protein